MTEEDREELISAALDGERVDVEALRNALSGAEGRASLASFVLLRAAMAADRVEPRRSLQPQPTGGVDGRGARRIGRVVRLPLGLAAAAAVVIAAGAFWIGSSWYVPETHPTPSPSAVQSSPPEPGRSPHATPADDVPPTPARVLRYTPGVDWHPSS